MILEVDKTGVAQLLALQVKPERSRNKNVYDDTKIICFTNCLPCITVIGHGRN